MDVTQDDVRWMELALALSKTGLGRAWPNPAVGCLLVRDGCVVGQACTGPGGRPHAEQLAVLQAGELAEGATAYVSLEPCSHWGVTSPCTLVLHQAKVSRVVIATRDPDPRVDGSGIDRLRHYGIEVKLGVLDQEARELHAGFITRVRRGRPLLTVAPSASAGSLCDWAFATGQDAVMISLAGHRAELSHAHVIPRILVDLQAGGGEPEAIPPSKGLPRVAFPRWLVHADGRSAGPLASVDEIFDVAAAKDRIDVKAVLAALGGRGLTRVAVAAADPLAVMLREAGLVDRDGVPAVP